jgi:predicted transcriptional regulator
MATKNKGPLTKVEKFYIDNNQNQPVKELATDLLRTEKTIQKYLDTLNSDDTEHIAKSKSDIPSAGENKFNPDVIHKIKDD